MNQLEEKLNWRYATKKFDPTRKISDETLNVLKNSIQLAPTSYGLQPFQVLIVENPEIRQVLKSAAWGQTQVTDASHLLVFTRKKNVNDAEVDEFIENIMNTRGVPKELLLQYEAMMKGTINSLTEDQKSAWIDKQIYIALGFLLTRAASLMVDSCPMEGFDRTRFDEILGLTDTTSVVICPIGYRDDNDEYQHYKKVRKSQEQLFVTV
jgi:nitroreductase